MIAARFWNPNGKVLLLIGGIETKGKPHTPSAFVEYDPSQDKPHGTYAVVDNAPTSVGGLDQARMLLLPNGHGLVALDTGDWYDLTFDSGGDASWAPTISSFPAQIVADSTVTLAGTQLCGLSECQSFGDDNQQSENYPVVRFVDSHGNVTYARAHDVSTRSIAPREPGTVLVDIPNLALGEYTVHAVAMGTPSQGRAVSVVLHAPTPVVSKFSVAPSDVICGNAASAIVTLDPYSVQGPAEVVLTSGGPNKELVQIASPVTVAKGRPQSEPFPIKTTNLTTAFFEPKPVTLTARVGAQGQAKSVTLNIVTPTVSNLRFVPNPAPLGSTCKGVLTLDRAALFPIQVELSWAGGWLTSATTTVSFNAGETVVSFPTAIPPTIDAFESTQGLLYATYAGTNVSAWLTLEPGPETGVLADLSVPKYEVSGGSTVTGTVSLQSVVSEDTVVALRVSPTVRTRPGSPVPLPEASVPPSVPIPAGTLSADFSITTKPLPAAGSDHTVSISANAFVTKTAILTFRTTGGV